MVENVFVGLNFTFCILQPRIIGQRPVTFIVSYNLFNVNGSFPILRDCDDIELGFTMYEEEENGWRCSFRSDGKWINVNELLKPFGGGGHISAAGLKYQTDNVEELKKQILDRVAEMKNKQ